MSGRNGEDEWPASSIFQIELGYRAPRSLRVGGLHMRRLVRPGSIVKTSYGSGPYVVVSMTADFFTLRSRTFKFWCFELDKPEPTGPKWPRPNYWLNEYVASGKRIVSLFPNSDDEIYVVGFSDQAARALRPKPRQLPLFEDEPA